MLAQPVIFIHASVSFDPDRFEEAKALVRDLAEASRAEPGTIRYRAMVDLEAEHTIRFVEQYEDEAALRAHTETAHYARFVDRLPDLADGPMESINVVDPDTIRVHEFSAAELAADEP